jgi:alkanesulfonate monooxygenase SsuD/methylene tetrahydromethanopterin reductase-like flavin-dependent oxidoreductase (luciferase family)
MPSVAEARAHAFDAEELALIDAFARGRHVGTAKVVRERLRELAEDSAADEVMVMSAHDDHEARKRSYSLLSALW